jgi:hypothetical protein
MQLTTNFNLSTLTISKTANQFGIDNTPSDEVIGNLKSLCENVLEPLQALLGESIYITSGYRSKELNKKIGGAKKSQHMEGKAADIHVNSKSTEELFIFIKKNFIGFDQLIQEFDSWVHISYDGMNNRNMDLRAIKENGKTKYLPA